MFYIILLVLFIIAIGIMTLAEQERKTIPVQVAGVIDSAMSGIGFGLVTYYLARYISDLI
ncbi:hypothetical protein EBOKLHFM_00122 [Klebsiella phage KP13-26]|nr:hypothetical protein EBOKLHFM_00122 [Klebsiella phage KP13-26]